MTAERTRPVIVMSGAGLITSLGVNRRECWSAALAGHSGIRKLTAVEQPLARSADGGESPLAIDGGKNAHREVTGLRYTVDEALRDAGLSGAWPVPLERCGIILGTTLAGMRNAGEFLRSNDYGVLRHFLAEDTLQSAAHDLPVCGFSTTTCAACASGLSSIALAMTLIEAGVLDLAITGGYEPMSEYAYAGFRSLRLVTEDPLMPFSKKREGMKLGEGWGIMILERADSALRRGVEPLVAVRGFGESSDADHLTHPHPEGRGAARAMRAAIERAGIAPEQIDLVSAHATATPANDIAEWAAYCDVFGRHVTDVSVTALKSSLGHTLGGAGAVELILTAMALRDQVIPPTVGTCAKDIEFEGIRLQLGSPLQRTIRNSISVSMGFGGANAAVVMSVPDGAQHLPAMAADAETQRDVLVTGVGVVMPHAVGNKAFVALMRSAPQISGDLGPVDEEAIKTLVNVRRVRRMSSFTKLVLAAATEALIDSGIDDVGQFAADCSVILGTAHGAAEYSETYYRQVVDEGIDSANPMLFAEGVPNVASAQLSLMLDLRGGAQTIIGSRNAGIDALLLAAHRIRQGDWDRAIVGAAEEFSPLVNDAYRHCGLAATGRPGRPFGDPSGFAAGCGATVLVLESRSAVEGRGVTAYANIVGGAARRATRNNRGNILATMTRLLQPRSGSIVLSSANGTWIDDLERRAIAAAWRRSAHPEPVVRTVTDVCGEMFSVVPLAALAASLLDSTDFEEFAAEQITVLCTSFSGLVGSLEIERIARGARQ